jgi:hypothetical protein
MPHVNEEQLSAYLDRQLDADGNGLVEMHLRECESCSGLVEEMREVTKLFRSAERLEPSPFLWTRIAAGFEHETMERSRKRGWGTSVLAGMRRFGWNSGIAATALGILMFVGITIFKEPSINPAALAEIDRVCKSLAAEDPDAFNPFSSGLPSDVDANPFRSARLNGRTNSAPLKSQQH